VFLSIYLEYKLLALSSYQYIWNINCWQCVPVNIFGISIKEPNVIARFLRPPFRCTWIVSICTLPGTSLAGKLEGYENSNLLLFNLIWRLWTCYWVQYLDQQLLTPWPCIPTSQLCEAEVPTPEVYNQKMCCGQTDRELSYLCLAFFAERTEC